MALEDFKFYKIRLDRADMTMAAPLTAKEGAVNGNGIELQVINGSTIEDMSNFAVYLNWKHQTTGAQGSEPFTLVDLNNAVYRLHYPTEMLVGGVVRADIKVVDAESVTVSTAELSIRVAQAATDTTVQSENAWNDIQAILVQNQANATRMNEIEADLANVPSFDEIASKPTNEATANANTVLASNGDGTGTFKDAGTIIGGSTTKTTPVDADTLALSDSAAAGALKKLSWANIKAALKAYLDTIYAAITHGHNQSDIANLTTDLAGKAPTAHGHSIGDVTNLQTTLAGKSDTGHAHDDRYYTEAEVNATFAPKANPAFTGTQTLPNIVTNGIKFPATQVPSSDPNTLDDYEEGTFTPTVFGSTSAGVGTYTSRSGKYTKTGNLVHIEIVMSWSAHTGTGNLKIGGLPFLPTGSRASLSIVAETLSYSGQLGCLDNFLENNLSLFSQQSGIALFDVAMDSSVSYLVITGDYATS